MNSPCTLTREGWLYLFLRNTFHLKVKDTRYYLGRYVCRRHSMWGSTANILNSKGVWTWKHLKGKGSMDIHYAITISTNWDSIWSVLIKSSGCYNLTQPEPSEVTPLAGVPMARRTKNSNVRSPENTALCISPLCSALYLAPFCSFYSPDLSVSTTECLRRQFPRHQVTSVSLTQF